MSRQVSRKTKPCAANSSITGRVTIATSKAAPFSMARLSALAGS